MTDFSESGAFRINGQWVTALRYEAGMDQDGKLATAKVEFLNGRRRVETAEIATREAALALLGERNVAAIEAGIGIDKESRQEAPRGRLQGPTLAYHAADSRGREASPTSVPTSAAAPDRAVAAERGGASESGAATAGPGAFRINGQLVTSIHYEARVKDARVVDAALTFARGGSEVATFNGDRMQLLSLIGERNLAAIESGAGERDDTLRGELRGTKLHYREAVLPDPTAQAKPHVAPSANTAPENAIERDSSLRQPEAGQPPAAGAGSGSSANAAPAGKTGSSPAQSLAIPPEVERRFVRVKDRFYFPDRSLAFVDQGTRLKAETENIEVLRSLVEIARARGWDAIRVTGTDAFRSQVWHEAARQGIAVRGYAPTEVERALLARELSQNAMGNAPASSEGSGARTGASHSASQPSASAGAAAAAVAPSTSSAGAQRPPQRSPAAGSEVLFGNLLEIGEAPYRLAQGAARSPFIRVATDQGERVLWGMDFPRALSEAKTRPQVGDVVGVEYQGMRPVTVKVPVKANDGSVQGQQEINTYRYTWLVEKPEFYEKRQAQAAALRHARTTREQLAAEHPELAAAITWVHLAERLAQRSIADAADQERFVAMVREGVAQAIGRSQPLSSPKLHVPTQEQPVRKEDRAVEAGQRVREPERVMTR